MVPQIPGFFAVYRWLATNWSDEKALTERPASFG
jgi:hypothetical protein